MKYILLIYNDEALWHMRSEDEKQAIYAEYRKLIEDLKSKGNYLTGDQLQASTSGSTVRVRNNKPILTDGPFVETREQIGGFFIIEAQNDEEARAIAARIPTARDGAIEVRPAVVAAAAKPA